MREHRHECTESISALPRPRLEIQDGDISELLPERLPNLVPGRTLVAAGRYGKAGEVSGLVAYLASDEAAYVTGQNIRIDGGLTRGV